MSSILRQCAFPVPACEFPSSTEDRGSGTPHTIRILIADDHYLVRQGLRLLISSDSRMELVGEAADGEEAVEQARRLHPDVILLDLKMPRKDGVGAIVDIRDEYPAARILVLTSFAEDERILQAIRAGALGYLLKDSAPAELLEAIVAIGHGHHWLPPATAGLQLRDLPVQFEPCSQNEPLTTREGEVLQLVALGQSNQQIARDLIISERTVRNHVSNILTKLALSSRTQAAAYAFQKGIVRVPPRSP
jgi:NarL family two-component system response regulator LiaR